MLENPQLILAPVWYDRLGELLSVHGVPDRLRQEIEQFFVSATFFTGKNAKVTGWRGPDEAVKLVKDSGKG